MSRKSLGKILPLNGDRHTVHGSASGQEPPSRVVVLGVGNMLLSDEGVGVHVVNALAAQYQETSDVAITDGGTGGMELLPLLDGAGHLIVVDALRCGQPPACIVRLEYAEVPAYFKTKLSPHQVGISDLLAALAFKGAVPGHVVLIGVEPANLSLGMELSPEVQECLEEVKNVVVAELEAIGHPIHPRI